MKKRTISKLKSIFGSKKGKRQHESLKSSRASTPEPPPETPEFRPVQRTPPPPPRPGPPPSPPVPTNPIAPVPPEPSGPLSLKPCPVCGRTFNPQSLAKHVNICQKTAVKKRKLFDSSRQRREGTDLEQFLPRNFGLPENSPFLEKSPPPTAKPTVRPKCTAATSSVKSAITKPANDLQRCPHCSRAFGVRAFERHVEWCADKAKILPAAPAQGAPHIADAKQRLNARTQYKAPLVRGRRKSSQTRDKSHSRSGSVESSRGVSPPRDFGDYKHNRPRASESMSSNEYHEDPSPHVPVIRTSRPIHGGVSGDANVKARQARLARDLSSTRHSQESLQRESKQPSKVRNDKNPRKEKPLKHYSSSERRERNRQPSPIDEYNDEYHSPRRDENIHKHTRSNTKNREEKRYQSTGKHESNSRTSPRNRSNYILPEKDEQWQDKNSDRSLRDETCSTAEKKYINPQLQKRNYSPSRNTSMQNENYCRPSNREKTYQLPTPRKEADCKSSEKGTNYQMRQERNVSPTHYESDYSYAEVREDDDCNYSNPRWDEQRNSNHTRRKTDRTALSSKNEGYQHQYGSDCSSSEKQDVLARQISERSTREYPSPRETSYPPLTKRESYHAFTQSQKSKFTASAKFENTCFDSPRKENMGPSSETRKIPSAERNEQMYPAFVDHDNSSTVTIGSNKPLSPSPEKTKENYDIPFKRPTSYTIAYSDEDESCSPKDRDERNCSSQEKVINNNIPSTSHCDFDNPSPRRSERKRSHLPVKREYNRQNIVREEIINTPTSKCEELSSPKREYDSSIPSKIGKSHLPVRRENKQIILETSETLLSEKEEKYSRLVEDDRNHQPITKNKYSHSAKIDSDYSLDPPRTEKNQSPICQSTDDYDTLKRERNYSINKSDELNNYPAPERFEIKNSPRNNKRNKNCPISIQSDSDHEENSQKNTTKHVIKQAHVASKRNKNREEIIDQSENIREPAKPNLCERSPFISEENREYSEETVNNKNDSTPDQNENHRKAAEEESKNNQSLPREDKLTVLASDETVSHTTQKETKNSASVLKKPKLIAKLTTEEKEKLRAKLSFKKEQKLQKLEELAQKYEERTKRLEEEDRLAGEKMKSQIPVSKTKTFKNKQSIKSEKDIQTSLTQKGDSSQRLRTAQKSSRSSKLKKQTSHLSKDSSMSLDSLETKKLQDVKSIGMNTMLCPCVPCVIHKPGEQKMSCNKKSTKSNKKEVTHDKSLDILKSEPKLEIVYKNENLLNSSVIAKKSEIVPTPNRTSISNSLSDNSINCKISSEDLSYKPVVISTISNNTVHSEHTELDEENSNTQVVRNDNSDDMHDLTTENFEEAYEGDNSNPDEFLEDKYLDHKHEIDEQNIRPQGSGDTYTKFSDNLDDLEEFLNITDKMMNKPNENIEEHGIEETVKTLHTPKTVSVEALSHKTSETITDNETKELRHHFSDTFEDLKKNLKDLLFDAGPNLNQVLSMAEKNRDEMTKNPTNDSKQTTMCQEKQNTLKNEITSELKLPSIDFNNKPECKTTCSQKNVQNIYKPRRRYKTDKKCENYNMVQNEDDNSDLQSLNNEGPPLKLPRIEQTGLDDNYDPFASAARQMKELMSSDTNLPKKVLDSYKDPNRTLPILRPKEKTNLSTLRSGNTKLMKDSLNKTYQKTPTLQRFQSFGGSNNENQNNSFGGRCSSFRVNRQISNDKKSSQKLNTTFTKSSKENILTAEKNYFNRNSSLNRSFSSYTASSYSTPKLKDKVPKIASSMSHSFQRTTIKQPVKLDKIKKEDDKKDFVNLESILADSHISDNSSMTDSNYIDPRLINENDNLPINVNTILNNPDILSSMESLLTQHKEILPTKFESFSSIQNNNNNNNKDCDDVKSPLIKLDSIKNNNINNNVNNKIIAPLMDDLSIQYDKIMSSLEQSIGSKTSIRDDDSLCEDFDLEEFMTSFDEEVNKQKIENKRTCSSTTRVVKAADLADGIKTSGLTVDSNPSPKVVCNGSNGFIPVNKSMSLNFSSNSIVSESLFPPSMKRSNSLIDSMQKKPHKTESTKTRHKTEQLEQDILHSLKEIDQYYEQKCIEHIQGSKEMLNGAALIDNAKRDSRGKSEKSSKKDINTTNGNFTPNGKSSDSAYSSLNRISPSKLSVCNSKATNGVLSLEQIPAESDSSGCLKDDLRSLSSEEFLAMERSTELGETASKADTHVIYKESDKHEKRSGSRASSRQSSKWRSSNSKRQELSSSGSEASLPRVRRDSVSTAPSLPIRLSRFCHECGCKFPVDTAKFCIECGVKRLAV